MIILLINITIISRQSTALLGSHRSRPQPGTRLTKKKKKTKMWKMRCSVFGKIAMGNAKIFDILLSKAFWDYCLRGSLVYFVNQLLASAAVGYFFRENPLPTKLIDRFWYKHLLVPTIDLKRITRCKLALIFTSADHRQFLGLFGYEAARL